jgi:hypothetical protein
MQTIPLEQFGDTGPGACLGCSRFMSILNRRKYFTLLHAALHTEVTPFDSAPSLCFTRVESVMGGVRTHSQDKGAINLRHVSRLLKNVKLILLPRVLKSRRDRRLPVLRGCLVFIAVIGTHKIYEPATGHVSHKILARRLHALGRDQSNRVLKAEGN